MLIETSSAGILTALPLLLTLCAFLSQTGNCTYSVKPYNGFVSPVIARLELKLKPKTVDIFGMYILFCNPFCCWLDQTDDKLFTNNPMN